MQFHHLLTLFPILSFTSAVTVCNNYHINTGGCAAPCFKYSIAQNQRINVPNTNCIYNSDTDAAFNLLVCSGPDLNGECVTLTSRQSTDITGDFNWIIPGTGSILRIG
ncbi:hypothetical protein HYFRA_00000405 [Hymenoscyphus fraxineus]|uniref:Cyanovirin-N domain-containing protein n=1 Tax=Hymenoscyphus fraxineus TaxID=746836 RepID=A0A9N9L1G2_9HELO|nr:hypothetical protein HYFRA_00000405 [Hymenoscyphus fraxineus]